MFPFKWFYNLKTSLIKFNNHLLFMYYISTPHFIIIKIKKKTISKDNWN